MGHHIPTWSFISYLVSAALLLFLGSVVLVRGLRQPGGLRRIEVLASFATVIAAAVTATLGWNLH